ncbi:MAG: glycosyltransferase family 9 protein, partial [Bacteroidia bacterium]|nr:glycosyltransferase family 9 protein [Bacteroidia bacterium]
KINIHIRKILVIQLGDIGDVVWAIPAFWALKTTFPQAGLSVLVRNPNRDLLSDDPHIDKIFQVDQQSVSSGLRLLKNLRREKFDLLFDLRADDRGAFISFFSGARIRAALYCSGLFGRNRAFTHLVDPPLAKERILGAAEQSLQIIRGFGIKETTSTPQIFVTEKLKDKMSALLTEEKIETKHGWVSINPFSRWPYKEWDMDKWRQLALFIWKKYKMPVIITGSTIEKQRAEALAMAGRSPIYNLAGKTTLREMAALLQMSRLHIGVDSAAPHIAAAVGTPTITIYGPSDWHDWAPSGERNQVVLPDMDCSPCHKKGCDGNGRSKCLDNLPVVKVQDAVKTMLNKFVSEKH